MTAPTAPTYGSDQSLPQLLSWVRDVNGHGLLSGGAITTLARRVMKR